MYNKRIQESYSVGSREDPVEDTLDNDALELKLKKLLLGEIFTAEHANLVTVISILMQTRGTVFAVQPPLLDPEDRYWLTGEYKYDELDPLLISPTLLVGAGRVQQVTCAALQILYAAGRKGTTGEDHRVTFKMNKRDKFTTITISFKFHGQDINMAILEHGVHSSITLYIVD